MEKLVHIVGNEEWCGLSSKEKEETIAAIMQFADDYMCTRLY